jgi:hypothetical protein
VGLSGISGAQAVAGSGFAGVEKRIVTIPSTKGKGRAGRGPFGILGSDEGKGKKSLPPIIRIPSLNRNSASFDRAIWSVSGYKSGAITFDFVRAS